MAVNFPLLVVAAGPHLNELPCVLGSIDSNLVAKAAELCHRHTHIIACQSRCEDGERDNHVRERHFSYHMGVRGEGAKITNCGGSLHSARNQAECWWWHY